MNSLKRVFLLALFLPLAALAQTVSGVVTEAETGQPLPGVNVIISGTSTGTTTDFDGNYSINATNGSTLVFSYLGYATQEIPYTGQSTLNITLIEDNTSLEAVVLIGYGSTQQEDITGAVEQVDSEEFNKGTIVSPGDLIAGKSAGVEVVKGSGDPAAGPRIRIRAGSTLSAIQDPLYVVDGIPLDQVNANLNTVNPNDIETFTILKDASATAIYGSRASNGVILITTKKGRRNQPLTVEYGMNFSVSRLFDRVDVLDANQFRALAVEQGVDQSLLGDSNTNWQDEIYQAGTGVIHNLTVAKGWENNSLRVNANLTNQNGVLKTSGYRRHGLNLTYTHRLFDNALRATITSQNANENVFQANQGAIGAATVFDPTQSVNGTPGQFGGFFEFVDQNGNLIPTAPKNPLGLLEQFDSRTDNDQTRNNLNLVFDLPWVDGLSLNSNTGFDYNEYEGYTTIPAQAASNFFSGGFDSRVSGFRRNVLIDVFGNYKKALENAKLDLDFTAGHSFQKFTRLDRNTFTNNQGDFVTPAINPVINENALESYYGRAIVDYNDLLVLNLSARYDGSSRFAEDNRWGFFPAASVAVKLDQVVGAGEGTLSSLKFRAGVGQTGQQEIGPSYGFLGLYTPGGPQAQVQFGQDFVTTIRPEGFDSELKWEETTQYNVGVDYGMFNNRLKGSIDAYYRETEDLLAFIPVAAGSNLENFLTTNAGSTESRGIEFGLNYALFQNDDDGFNWDLGANVTFSEIEITNLTLGDDPNFEIAQGGIAGGVGNTIQTWAVGFDPTTYNTFVQAYDTEGAPIEGVYVDVNGDNVINDEDRVKRRKATPDAFVGLTSNMNYKNWDMSFTFRGAFGHYNYNNIESNTGYTGALFNTPGPYYANGSTSVLENGFNNAQLFSDIYVQKADYVKLDNISLGYLFPGDRIDLRASVSAQNVFVITGYDGLDPEIPGGIDNNLYPIPRIFTFGLNFNFK